MGDDLLVELRRIADALERIADRDIKPAKLVPTPKRPRALTDEQVRETTRRKLARAGALPR